jgi:hypothetical protein
MPGFALHRLLIYTIRDAWLQSEINLPLDLKSPAIMNAMLVGGCIPDLMSGTNPEGFHTGLAHYIKTGSFARNLADAARTPVQKAFAWGWVIHVIADTRIHPFINRHCEEIKSGRFGKGLSYADDPILHIRVETGVDVFAWNTYANVRDMSYLASLNDSCSELLCIALNKTYGLSLAAFNITRSLLKGIRMARLAPWLMNVFAGDWYDNHSQRAPLPFLLLVRLMAFLTGLVDRRANLYALTHLIKPSDKLISDVSDAIIRCKNEFAEMLQAGIGSLKDWNLDTGRLEIDSLDYPLYLKTKAELEAYCQ